MSKPDEEFLTRRLSEWLTAHADFILPPEQAWRSGVYMVLDAVFSSRAKYHAVVVPMLRRLGARRPGLADEPGLTFSAFVADVDSCGEDRFETFSRAALNRQKIAGRLKTEVAYEMAAFFVKRDLETLADLRGLPAGQLATLVTDKLRWQVRGIGPTLSDFLLMRFGQTDRIKADVMVERFFAGLSDWTPRGTNPEDVATLRRVIGAVAAERGLTATQVDSAIWRYESGTGTQGTKTASPIARDGRTPEERLAAFREALEHFKTLNLSPLPEEAFERASFYEDDRGILGRN